MSIETPEIKQIAINVIEVSERAARDDATVGVCRSQRCSFFRLIDVYHDGEKYWLDDGFHRPTPLIVPT